jgi:hypothetical protein
MGMLDVAIPDDNSHYLQTASRPILKVGVISLSVFLSFPLITSQATAHASDGTSKEAQNGRHRV